MRSLKNAVAVVVMLAATSTTLYGQQPPAAPAAPSAKPDCATDSAAPTNSREATTGRAPLSERLSEFKGVICPPKGVDPGIVERPAPTNAPMLVIPPPGTPGGDPSAQPK
jgi:hypothetical protein